MAAKQPAAKKTARKKATQPRKAARKKPVAGTPHHDPLNLHADGPDARP